MKTRARGVAIAFCTAVVSGISIYLNGKAVRHFGDATVYTTAKNAVAGLLLVALAIMPARGGRPSHGRLRASTGWPALLVIAVVGGSVPFVLFFEGLARAQATQASFIQKTLVVWVALLAVPLLKERFGAPHALAVGLLVGGQAWFAGSVGHVAFGTGEAMILAATLLWAVEVVYVKRLLGSYASPALAAARMGLGTVLLLGWLAVTGRLGQLGSLDAGQWRWILLTGLLLTAYVATWYAALACAQAVDVTAVLVFGAVVTAVLSGAPVNLPATLLVSVGTAIAAAAALRPKTTRTPA
jgi:drug/metabolite transporter (DMT)-like permease